jgi:hypothetical protein
MSDNRFLITTTLDSAFFVLKPGGKYNSCSIGFKIPPEDLARFDKVYERCLAWGANKFQGKRHEKALPKWEEDGSVMYFYGGDDNPPMFPWVDADGQPIDLDTQIWRGTVVRLIIDLKPYVFGNKTGCSFKVRGAQIIKLVSSGGGSDQGTLDDEDVASLFGKVDGFSQASPDYQPPAETEDDSPVSEEALPF